MLSKTVAIGLAIMAPCAIAFAQSLRIESMEQGSWPQTVAALQANRASEGHTIHVVVHDDDGRLVRCGAYALSLDAIGAAAFRVGPCDPATSATSMTLISRHTLFGHDAAVPRPLAVGLSATEVRTGATSGGAQITGGSTLDCSVGVRPYLDDLEHGEHVYLTPDRYVVQPRAVGVEVETIGTGWLLRSGSRASLTIDYDVADRSTGEVVLHDRATLVCASGSQADPLPGDDDDDEPVAAAPLANSLTLGERREGDTRRGIDRHTPTCGSLPGSPDETWTFTARTTAAYRIDVDSTYDGVLAVYAHGTNQQLGCNDDTGSARASRVDLTLAAGETYDVVVDGYHGLVGTYGIVVAQTDTPPDANQAPLVSGTSAPSPASQSHGDDTLLGWGGMFYLGAAVWLTAGIVFALSASADHDSLVRRCAAEACTDSMLSGLRSDAQWADISFGLSLGHAVLATLLVVLGLPQNNGSGTSAQLTPNGFRVQF